MAYIRMLAASHQKSENNIVNFEHENSNDKHTRYSGL